MMNISYRFASTHGDIIADDSMLDRPFAMGPGEYHDFMTLRDFFDSIQRFLLAENKSFLTDISILSCGRPVKAEEIEGMAIRYEKYGTLYQICSVDISMGESSARMCVTVALSEQAKKTLEREFRLLAEFQKHDFNYLPRAYKKDQVEASRAERGEVLVVALLQWFEGYEEWHFQRQEGATRAFLWDMRGDYRFLSEAQTFDAVRQASRILTVYYDVESTRRIIPWHHGGGDFIVKISGAEVDVKLVTARGYEPIFSSEEQPLAGLCAFCIETLTKMRLDKWEGMGDSTWADYFVLQAALEGFVDGLRAKQRRGEMGGLTAQEVVQELKSHGIERLKILVERHILQMKEYDSSDYAVVLGHLDSHVSEINTALQSFVT